MTTQTQTPYETRYAQNLRIALEKVSSEWAEAGQKARNEFAEKVANGGSFGNTGPFGYQIGWSLEGVIAAEVKESVAAVIRHGLGAMAGTVEVEERPSAEDVLRMARGSLKQIIRDGLQASSTSEASNVVARFAGRAALDLEESGSSSLEWGVVATAKFATTDELVGTEARGVRQARSAVKGAEQKVHRAKSENGVAKAKEELDSLNMAASYAFTLYEEACDAAGIPAEARLKA